MADVTTPPPVKTVASSQDVPDGRVCDGVQAGRRSRGRPCGDNSVRAPGPAEAMGAPVGGREPRLAVVATRQHDTGPTLLFHRYGSAMKRTSSF